MIYVIGVVRAASYKLHMLNKLMAMKTPAKELCGIYTSLILWILIYATPA